MPSDLITLSPASWMQLPGVQIKSTDFASRESIAEYYRTYSSKAGLSDYFVHGAEVIAAEKTNGYWLVTYLLGGRTYQLKAKTLVSAVGMYDRPKYLGISEETHPFVSHRIPSQDLRNGEKLLVVGMMSALHYLSFFQGSGLSAADCIWFAENFRKNVRVFHVFRSLVTKGSGCSICKFEGYVISLPSLSFRYFSLKL